VGEAGGRASPTEEGTWKGILPRDSLKFGKRRGLKVIEEKPREKRDNFFQHVEGHGTDAGGFEWRIDQILTGG